MATAGTTTLTSTDTAIFDAPGADGNCGSYFVRNTGTPAVDALVRVTPLHKSGEYVTIPPGEEKTFRGRNAPITRVDAKGNTAVVQHGVIEI